jgi:hypothetical protein
MKKQLLLLLSIVLFAQNNVFAQDSEYVLFFDQVTEIQSIKYSDDATTSIMDGATDYTIEMWVLPTDNTQSGEVFLSMRNMLRLTFYTNNRFYFTHKDPNASTMNTFYNVTDNALTLNQWNHIAVICNSTDGANGSVKLYVNGVDVTVQAYEAKTLVGGAANNDVFVGYGGSGTYPNMMAREIRVKKTAVDPATFHVALSDANYATDADTAVLFHFSEGSGTTTVNAASGVDANLGFSGAHYPTWVLLTDALNINNNKNIDFSIYPNPVNAEHFMIQTKNDETLKSIEITDVLGKVVRSVKFDNQPASFEVSTSNLRKGIYLVKTVTNAGIGTQKLIIE